MASKGRNEFAPQAAGRLFTDAECGLLEEIIFHRRDVRGNRFTNREISDQALDRILNAALRAPSVGFSQPWRFVVVRDPATKLRVRDDFERENLKAVPRFHDSRRDLYGRLKLEGITEAPVNIAVFYEKSEEAVLGQTSISEVGPYSVVCAIQNMWLLARALNIGMGWVSILNPPRVKNILRAPDSFQLVAYLCLGYVDRFEEQPELERLGWSSRKTLDTLVQYETWGGNGPTRGTVSVTNLWRGGGHPAAERGAFEVRPAPPDIRPPDSARADERCSNLTNS